VDAHRDHPGDDVNVDLQTDARHCGGCGQACETGQACAKGACQAACLGLRSSCTSNTCCQNPSTTCAAVTVSDCGGPNGKQCCGDPAETHCCLPAGGTCTSDCDCCGAGRCCPSEGGGNQCVNDNCDGLD
jgi:hypothetical protein